MIVCVRFNRLSDFHFNAAIYSRLSHSCTGQILITAHHPAADLLLNSFRPFCWLQYLLILCGKSWRELPVALLCSASIILLLNTFFFICQTLGCSHSFFIYFAEEQKNHNNTII